MLKFRKNSTEIKVSTDNTVEELQKLFKKSFGVTLRVFNKLQLVRPHTKFKEITDSTAEFIITSENTIHEVIEQFKNHYGIKIQIADAEDKILLEKERKLNK